MSFRDELYLLRMNMDCMRSCLAKLMENEEAKRNDLLEDLFEIDCDLKPIDLWIEAIFYVIYGQFIDHTENNNFRLSRCPFCSSFNVTAIPNSSGWCVECDSCHAEGPLETTRDAAEQEWNRRS